MRGISFFKYTISVIALLMVCYFFCTYSEEESSKYSGLNAEVIKVSHGFGYIINHRGKILIRQENIPALPDERSFCTKHDAFKVSRLVLKKLQSSRSPTVSMEDLMELEITTDCSNQN